MALSLDPSTLHQPDPLNLLGDAPLPPDILPVLVDYIKDRRDRNLDTYICCTGREGWGKSSLGLTLALALQPDLDPDDVILDQQDYLRVYDPEQWEQVYVFDEAGRLFFNRTWSRGRQVNLIQEVMENRQKRNTYFLHLPQMKVLDKYVREGRVELWMACTSQGRAMIRTLAYNSYSEEAYYPIWVDEHRWDPLEITHPGFAKRYYQRKDTAHKQAFNQRKRKELKQREEQETEDGFRQARRDAILATKD